MTRYRATVEFNDDAPNVVDLLGETEDDDSTPLRRALATPSRWERVNIIKLVSETPIIGVSLGSDDTPANRAHADRVDRAAFPDRPESERFIPRTLPPDP